MATRRHRFLAIAAVTVVAGLVAGCGSSGSDKTSGKAVDIKFLTDMTPHHRSAIEMAKIAQRRAEHPEVRRLADAIIASQGSEIALMSGLLKGLTTGTKSAVAHGSVMSPGELAMLSRARPFDREFIAMMVPHHEAAVAMAGVETADGTNPAAKALALRIAAAQTTEIRQMKSWYRQWYGKDLPSKPSSGGDTQGMSDMSHG